MIEIQPGAPGNKTIVIEGDPALVSEFQIESENGVLHIHATEKVSLSHNMRVIAPVSTLTRIVLEADEQAEVLWEGEDGNTILDQLDIKLEANSRLGLLGLKIRNINIQQEAESKLFLNSALAGDQGEIKVEKENVVLLNDTTAVVNNERLVYFETAEALTEGDVEYFTLTGENLRSFFLVENVKATLQATSEMLADGTPVNHYEIKLEGESTADIWAVKTLFGKGEGSSVLYYYGNPTVDYVAQGNAQIVNH